MVAVVALGVVVCGAEGNEAGEMLQRSVECRSAFGSVSVSLVGAQVTSWRSAAMGGDEVFFMPENAPWGDEVHGGVPLCWPWFGRREGLPIHGLVRYMVWRLVKRHDNGVELATESTAESLKLWPHAFRLTAKIMMVTSNILEIAVAETNAGDTPFESAFGIHPYFAVSNALSVAVDGRRLRHPNGDTTKFPADGKSHVLSDLVRDRACAIDAPYADSWWIWNPGDACIPLCKTLARNDWHHFWCLEALVREPKTLAPGEIRSYVARIKIIPGIE